MPADMSVVIAAAASGAVFLAIFFWLKSRAFPAVRHPVVLPEQDVAIRQAGEALARLCDLSVQDAKVFAAVWMDEEIADRLHQMRQLAPLEPVLSDWGLRGSWRIRFCFPWGTALIGLAPSGDVIALELTGDVPDTGGVVPPPRSNVDWIARLRGTAPGTLWARLALVGTGNLSGLRGEAEQSLHLRAEPAAGLRFTASVTATDRRLRRVHIQPEITATSHARGELLESLASVGSMVGALLAFVTATAVLALTDGVGETGFALALALTLLASVLVTIPDDLRYTTVNAFDGQMSWEAFRTINVATLTIQGTVMAGVVAVAAIAGGYVAQRAGLTLFVDPLWQIGWGVWAGGAWLALSVIAYAVLRARGWLDISPNPSTQALQLSGHGWLQALSISLQSSIGEEAVFRLLAIPALLWFSGSPWFAVPVAALLWALLHAGSAYRPRWYRVVELTVCGVGLGAVMLHVGFIAALVAHATYNALMLAAPLLAPPSPRARAATAAETAS